MTAMLEKAVRAAEVACDEALHPEGEMPDDWAAISVRAALLAIRDPDITMLHARTGAGDDAWWYEAALEKDFTAMIDAILNEKPESRA